MEVGICLPYSEPGITRKTLVDWCRALEDGPFGAVSCGERISGPDAMEIRNMLAGAALLTERIRIIPTLYILPMHNAVWAAKEIATLDILSEGRVDVVVGTGGRPNDYAAIGADFATRNARLPGQVATMRETWAGKPPFEGSEIIGPRPYQKGGPRVLGGFAGPKAIHKSAAWADGLYAFSIPGHASEIKEKMDWFDEGWAAAGRTGKPYKIGGFWYSLADGAKEGLHHYVYEYLRIAGHDFATSVADTMTQHDPGLILDTMRAMKETGIDLLFMVPASPDVTEVTRLGELVAKI
jgi:alkanesulfonate monooxygenase SsuD/methylene tetrahydromethanopterin reductase-like flavin-dependent oxidoreductase (luciferase family)